MKNMLLPLLVLHLGRGGVVAQPVITTQPQNQTAIAGTTAMFTVGATGATPLIYQWRFHPGTSINNYTNIPFGTEATLVLTNVEPTIHRFSVVVTESGGISVTSSPLVILTVLVPPSFTNATQPASRLAEVGDTVIFTAMAVGSTPLAYQWQWDSTKMAGKTTTNLILAIVQFTNAGGYKLIATNAVGAATSEVATLTVIPPVFTKITNGAIVNDGGFSFGCAWGDYNDDGFVDLFVCNYPENDGSQHDFLYRNRKDGTFERITTGPLVNAGQWAIGAAWGDYDNDGNLDIFVTGGDAAGALAPNRLFHNNGNGTFAKLTNGWLVTQPLYSHAGVWADFDRDGLIDLFVVNFTILGSGLPAKDNYLFRNKGDGTFAPNSFGAKLVTNGDSWNVAAADFTNDGWIDLFVPQGGTQTSQNSLLYTNNNGALNLVTTSLFSSNKANSVASAFADYDNDGFLDLFVSNFYGQNNHLWHNNRDGTFALVTNSIVTSDHGTSVGCAWGDYDNDGWLDLFVANLGPVNSNTVTSIAPENNFLYHNNGDGTFTKLLSGKLVSDLGYSTGCAWADYDNDGFLDLFVANGWVTASEKNFLYRNNGNSNNWITLKLVGAVSNRSAIGAKVRLRATIGRRTFWQMREISGGSNYGSQNDLRPSFGLGDATNIDLILIEWPSGAVQTMTNVATKQFLTVTESPRLSGAELRPGSAFEFQLTGLVGQQYFIESSSDLTDWMPWQTLTATNRMTRIQDPTSQAPQRFYRAGSLR